jgi:hypothetical protein
MLTGIISGASWWIGWGAVQGVSASSPNRSVSMSSTSSPSWPRLKCSTEPFAEPFAEPFLK